MKKKQNLWLSYGISLGKMIKIMRFTIFIVLISLSQAFAVNSYSQQTKLTINLTDVTVEKVIDEIEKTTDFFFLYNRNRINVDRKVDLRVQDESVSEVLDKIFEGTEVSYTIKNRQILLISNASDGESEFVSQQPKSVSGKITDASGLPLPGVAVVVKGTTRGTLSDTEGNYYISGLKKEDTLVFSFVGMKAWEEVVGQKTTIDIEMEDETFSVDEVVVTGYTQQYRRDISASVAKVDMKALDSNPASSLTSLLSGQAAGLQSITRSGIPGASGGGLVIRGNTSLSASDGVEGMSNPLYIVDGVQMSLQDLAGFDVSQNDFLSTLNPNEIQSIDILKDAAATAIYGSRGANGVIIISTKRGTKGESRVNASVARGIVLEPEKLDVFTGEAERDEKLRIYQETLTNLFGEQAWVDVRNGLEVQGYMLPAVLTDKYNPAFNNAYDFQDMFYKSGITQNYDLSIEGGSQSSSYRVGLSHYNEKGIIVGYGFSRTTLNASLVSDINKYFHNDLVIRYSFLDRKGGLNDYMRAMPTSPTELPSSLFYMSDEELGRLSGELGDAFNKNKSHSLTLSDGLRVKFTDHLALNNQASVMLMFGANDYFIPSSARADGESYGKSQSSTNVTFNGNSVLNYNREFDNHRLTVLMGTEINSDVQQMSWIEAENGSSDYLKVIQGYQKENINGYSDRVTTNMLSYFGSLSYGFNENKYQIEGVIRRDGSSRFGKNNKWATFPSVKGHWVFSKEAWMEGFADWLDFGKIRVSYGSSGSIAGDPLLQYNSLVSINNIGAGMNDIYRNDMDVKTYGGKTVLISDFDKVANRGLSWSKSTEINYGIDLEMFNRRLFVSGDIYSKYISDLVYTSNLPPYLGFNSIESNLVDMINSGFELNVRAYLFPRTNDFQWEWTANLSRNKSVIAELGNGGRDYINGDYAFVVGRPAFQYYTYEYIGALDSYDDLPVNPATGEALKYYGGDAGLALGLQGKIFPGMPLFTDVNGDFQIDGANYGNDKKIIENKSPEPKIMGGLHTSIKYKSLSLRIQSSFAFGHHIFNTTLQEQLSTYDDMNAFVTSALYKTDESKFWKGPGDGSYYPMQYVEYSDGGSVRAFRRSSMFIEKGDYWSVDNATLSYNVPKDILASLKIRGLNIYCTGNNLLMWKKSGVLDPRTVSKTGYYNGDGYPISRSFILGLQFQL